jgi:hypothetical protein
MTARLDTRKGADAPAAVMDLLELQRFAGGQLSGWNGFAQLESWLADPVGGAALQATLVVTGVAHSGSWSGGSGNEYAIGCTGVDQFYGNGGGIDKSRRWRDGERNAFYAAANDAVFEMRRAG